MTWPDDGLDIDGGYAICNVHNIYVGVRTTSIIAAVQALFHQVDVTENFAPITHPLI